MNTPDPQQPGPAGDDPRAGSAGSQQILAEITQRIARLQSELQARDLRVSSLEAELREARDCLMQEQAERSREQFALGELTERLETSQRQVDSLAHAAKVQADSAAERIRNLQMRLASVNEERERAMAAVRALQFRLAEFQAGAPAVNVADDTAGSDTLDTCIESAALGAGVAQRPALSADSPSPSSSRPVLNTLAASVAVLLICAGISVAVFLLTPPQHQVSAALLAPPGEGERLARAAAEIPRIDAAVGQLRSEVDPAAGVIRLDIVTRHPAAAAAALDRAAAELLASLVPATQPDRDAAEREALRARLRELDTKLATSPRPIEAGSDGQPVAQLLQSWSQLRTEREQVAKLAAEAAKGVTATMPDDAGLRVDAEQLRRAEAADPRLQADSLALAQREAQLADTMRVVLTAAEPRFKRFAELIPAADKLLEDHLKTAVEADVRASLEAMRQALADWSVAAGSLAEAWRRKSGEMAASGGDALTCRAALEPVAKAFLHSPAGSDAAMRRLLDALGQGGDQPTKRLVLRNALAREMQELFDAREGVAAAARSVLLAENLDLAAMVQRVAGLRAQVRARRERIIDDLRQAALKEVRARREETASQARAESQRLAARAAELDAAIMKLATAVLDRGAQDAGQRDALLAQLALYRQRESLLGRLAALDAAEAVRLPPLELRYAPARPVELVDAWRERLRKAVLAGVGPLLAVSLIAGLVAMLRSWRRGKDAMRQYHRAVREAVEEHAFETV